MANFPDDFQQTAGVWHARGTAHTIGYSDGAEVERYLHDVLGETADLRSGSPALQRAIRDWPSRYHLAAERSNLLRALKLRPWSRVLELGAGCGALTRYLGENCGRVLAVEGSASRAALARLRCRDLDNVEVIASDLNQVAFEGTFDVVTLIGVLEYAAMFGRGDARDPFGALLRRAAGCLADDGALVLAIENKLGLKYLGGCAEDHDGRPFSGIEGYPGPGAKTFGRVELVELLRRSGLREQCLLLPFPDYKLPDVVLHGAHAGAEDARRYNLVDWCRSAWEQYGGERYHLFSEPLALDSFARNGLLADVANSFLFLASRRPLDDATAIAPPRWIARGFNSARAPAYRTELTLETTADGHTLLRKRHAAAFPARDDEDRQIHHPRHEVRYVEGATSLSMLLLRALRRAAEQEQALAPVLRDWADFLREHASADDATARLPGRFLDCIPANLLRDPDGHLHYIDDEWSWPEGVSLGWVWTRGLHTFWARHRVWISADDGRSAEAQLAAFVVFCAGLAGLQITPAQVAGWMREEARFQAAVSGAREPVTA